MREFMEHVNNPNPKAKPQRQPGQLDEGNAALLAMRKTTN